MIQVANDMPPRRRQRPYLSFPLGRKLASPRVLLYAGDLAARGRRGLALAEAVLAELPESNLVVVTGSDDASRMPPRARIDVVKMPGLARENLRPLEAERIRRLRQKLLHTLFDVFLPDLLLLDLVGPEAEGEARILLARAKVFGVTAQIGEAHDELGQGCELTSHRGKPACARCCDEAVRAARNALAERSKKKP